MNPKEYSEIIKKEAHSLGFDFCGISKSGFLEKEAPNLERFLSNGMQGEMKYLENHFDKRLNPSLLHEGTKTIISLAYNYYPSEFQVKDTYKIAKYAYGTDYHIVVKEKCATLIETLTERIGHFDSRCFVDSAPIMEKVWAEKSGLGWVGKHGLLINPKQGSFFFLANILVDFDCEADGPIKDYCGSCTKCVDACPTEAILPNKVLDAQKCISYLTIELKNEIPTAFKNKMEDWVFGCDICQDVCPWNRFSVINKEPQFLANQNILTHTKSDWEEIKQEEFKQIFSKSAIKRTKFEGLKRNINFNKK